MDQLKFYIPQQLKHAQLEAFLLTSSDFYTNPVNQIPPLRLAVLYRIPAKGFLLNYASPDDCQVIYWVKKGRVRVRIGQREYKVDENNFLSAKGGQDFQEQNQEESALQLLVLHIQRQSSKQTIISETHSLIQIIKIPKEGAEVDLRGKILVFFDKAKVKKGIFDEFWGVGGQVLQLSAAGQEARGFVMSLQSK